MLRMLQVYESSPSLGGVWYYQEEVRAKTLSVVYCHSSALSPAPF